MTTMTDHDLEQLVLVQACPQRVSNVGCQCIEEEVEVVRNLGLQSIKLLGQASRPRRE